MIKAVIVDDEPEIRMFLKGLLQEGFSNIDVCGEADSVEGGISMIQEMQPQLVLLDIDIKGGTGFNILQKVKPYNFKLIFITAFNDYAIHAIKFSAMDYILKPVNQFEFNNAIENALSSNETSLMETQVTNFFDHYEKKTMTKKMVLRTAEALHLVNISDILYCKSDNSYTTFYIDGQKELLISKGMKEFEGILVQYGFIRPHQSFLVNVKFISKVDRTDGGFIILNNGVEIPVSSRRKQTLMQLLETL